MAWTPPDWRKASNYAPVLVGGHPALAWELLRRDPAYCAFFDRVGPQENPSRWGLHFRR